MTFLASLFFAAGVAAWVWSKVGRRTGYADVRSVWLVAGAAGVAAFVVFFTLLTVVLGLD